MELAKITLNKQVKNGKKKFTLGYVYNTATEKELPPKYTKNAPAFFLTNDGNTLVYRVVGDTTRHVLRRHSELSEKQMNVFEETIKAAGERLTEINKEDALDNWTGVYTIVV